jgi:hypothetical protein
LPLGVAQAIPATASSGIYENWTVDVTSVRYADGNTFLTIEKEGLLTGTTEGLITLTINVRVGKGHNTFTGIQICDPCTVGGRSGTYILRFEGKSVNGYEQGTWVYLSGTGDLANLHGHGTIEGTSTPDGRSLGTYSGEFHFDP